VDDPAAVASQVLEGNLYLVLGTVDDDGLPWTSPVYYAYEGRELFWVSAPDAQHSRNVAARPRVSIVVFDSSVPPGNGQAVYMRAVAEEASGEARLRGIDVFSRRSVAHGAPEWTLDMVQPPARLRLYRAEASEQYVLGEGDRRIPVPL
jgi:uncharacterized protein YhbP (UPF0306 family)